MKRKAVSMRKRKKMLLKKGIIVQYIKRMTPRRITKVNGLDIICGGTPKQRRNKHNKLKTMRKKNKGLVFDCGDCSYEDRDWCEKKYFESISS